MTESTTIRWDKNFLKLIYITLMRRKNFQVYGGVRFGGTLTAEDAWNLGFHHIGIAAGAYFAGQPHVLLMQNHGFLAAINGIVSLAQLYGIPLCMLIALRGHWGEPYPWHTRGGIVTENPE